ncbi:hypothetical protein BDA99DRAFT_496062 [Phascolomyces articulosus]|uniref:Uncharacterized protein n=1 Tax=Phascolomyces articulosus TaxID=60185 RepID=A0AAD5PJ03_9FUNG|nr:hypothetical protein BDA99DRAFT_496062 [Phascolomyces articulosus]
MSESHTDPLTVSYKSPTWPPDFSSYTISEEEEGEKNIIEILQTEANSRKAPDNYRAFLSKISRTIFELQIQVSHSEDQCKSYERKASNASKQCDIYAEYLATARENYDLLFDILHEERVQRMELEQKTTDLETEVEKLKQDIQQVVPPPPTISASVIASPSTPPRHQQPSQQQQQQQTQVHSQQQQSPPPQQVAVNHDACQQQIRHYKERIVDMERKMTRLASGRQGLEEQLIQQYKNIQLRETRVSDLDREVKRLVQLIQNKDLQYQALHADYEQLRQISAQVVQNNMPQFVTNYQQQIQHQRQQQQQRQAGNNIVRNHGPVPPPGTINCIPGNNNTPDMNNNNNNNNS